jgi:hypothetical protein
MTQQPTLQQFYIGSGDVGGEDYDIAALYKAIRQDLGVSDRELFSYNDLPEPWQTLKNEAHRLNHEAHLAHEAMLNAHGLTPERRRWMADHIDDWE